MIDMKMILHPARLFLYAATLCIALAAWLTPLGGFPDALIFIGIGLLINAISIAFEVNV